MSRKRIRAKSNVKLLNSWNKSVAGQLENEGFHAKARSRDERPPSVTCHSFLARFRFPFAPWRETVFETVPLPCIFNFSFSITYCVSLAAHIFVSPTRKDREIAFV